MTQVEIDLEEGVAVVQLDSGQALRPDWLHRAVKDADFSAGQIRARVSGHLRFLPAPATGEPRWQFVPTGVDQVFQLEEAEPGVLSSLTGERATIEGIVHDSDSLLTISVSRTVAAQDEGDGDGGG